MISLIGMVSEAKNARFDLVSAIVSGLGKTIRDGDVLVISSKFLAISEGRLVRLAGVKPGDEARRLSIAYRMDERLCELVIRESDEVIGGIPGFIMASTEGLLTPNAGIDKSNINHGTVVLYPRRPDESAKRIRDALRFETGVSVGVVVCDSRLSPTRRGTIGVALAASGLEAILDMRGRKDLFGNTLKVTSQAVADDLSSAAELLMGESDEATPVVLIRGLSRDLMKEVDYGPRRFAISTDDCVFMRTLGYSSRDGNPRNTLLGTRGRQ